MARERRRTRLRGPSRSALEATRPARPTGVLRHKGASACRSWTRLVPLGGKGGLNRLRAKVCDAGVLKAIAAFGYEGHLQPIAPSRVDDRIADTVRRPTTWLPLARR